jgi:hypothetical protein
MSEVTTKAGQFDYRSGMTYAEWYQTVEKPRLDAIPEDVRDRNAASHHIGVVADCFRCINCEIGSWNAWQKECV